MNKETIKQEIEKRIAKARQRRYETGYVGATSECNRFEGEIRALASLLRSIE